jgi:hypothetical protein
MPDLRSAAQILAEICVKQRLRASRPCALGVVSEQTEFPYVNISTDSLSAQGDDQLRL